jgi:hypothetical protein
MPAVTGGTGFVGFGDYLNANKQTDQREADQIAANDPSLSQDQANINKDTLDVASEVQPYLQNAQKEAVANDPNGPSLNPSTTSNYQYSVDANGPGSGVNQRKEITSTASPYAGQSQQQADYNQWENSQPGANGLPAGATAPGGVFGPPGARVAANQQDPNNPYGVQGGLAGLEANPYQLSGYNQAQQDISKQTQDQQQIANENTWGGAFGALQSQVKPDANGAYNTVGTGTGFDAALVQGDLSQRADAARQAEGGAAGEQTALNGVISSEGKSLQNSPYSPPAAPTLNQQPITVPRANRNFQPGVSPTGTPNAPGNNYPGQGFNNPYDQNNPNINRTQPVGGTY